MIGMGNYILELFGAGLVAARKIMTVVLTITSIARLKVPPLDFGQATVRKTCSGEKKEESKIPDCCSYMAKIVQGLHNSSGLSSNFFPIYLQAPDFFLSG